MTPRKETEPTDEQREAARKLTAVDMFPLNIEGMAQALARRDEARDAEVVRPWREQMIKTREYMKGLNGENIGEFNRTCLAVGELDKFLASPSPASSEPNNG